MMDDGRPPVMHTAAERPDLWERGCGRSRAFDPFVERIRYRG
jgi:hypothetical protein